MLNAEERHHIIEMPNCGDVQVYGTQNGMQPPPSLCLDLSNHSPIGFNQGYNGSGPVQLALAMLADHVVERAQRLYQNFKERKIAELLQGKLFHIISR